MALRWGIVSAGKISQDFVSALEALPKSDHQVVAVGARQLKSAQEFADRFKIPKAYEGYTGLAQDSNVDIAYIGNLNPQHHEVTKLMLENGKHVLCEKPFTMNEKQSRELIELAKSKKLFLMEAVWSRCFPVYTKLRELLDSGAIGEPLYVNVSFGFSLEGVSRLSSKEMGGGTILDLGIYTLQFQQFVFRNLKAEKFVGSGFLNEEGTDSTAFAFITYPGGKAAIMHTSASAVLTNEAVVTGTKGILRIPQFWCPTKLITPTETLEFELPKNNNKFNFGNSCGLAYEAEVARQCIKEGKIESEQISHNETIQLSNWMDTWRKQVGVVFPSDQ